ncbi:MAG: flavin reductase [Thermoguttaceae bacterium]
MKKSLGANTLIYPTPTWVVGTYDKAGDKFAATGLTAVRAEFVDAPYVQEFSLVLECKLLHTVEIGLHTQFIGEIMDVKAEENVLDPDGLPDMDKVRPFVFAPGPRTYYKIGGLIGKGFAIGKEFMKG